MFLRERISWRQRNARWQKNFRGATQWRVGAWVIFIVVNGMWLSVIPDVVSRHNTEYPGIPAWSIVVGTWVGVNFVFYLTGIVFWTMICYYSQNFLLHEPYIQAFDAKTERMIARLPENCIDYSMTPLDQQVKVAQAQKKNEPAFHAPDPTVEYTRREVGMSVEDFLKGREN